MLTAIAVAAEGGVATKLLLELFVLLHELEVEVLALEETLLCYLELEELVLLGQSVEVVCGGGVVVESLGGKDA